jgi:hypothetical protein
MKDLRKNRGEVSVDPELIRQGEQQLLSEISLLEQWLKTLDAAPHKDASTSKSITTYQDMLRSRQDMLAILRKQAKQ